jgi:protein CMS1
MPLTRKRAAEPVPEAKKKKRKTKFSQDDETLDMELGLNTLFTRMDNQLLADHLAQKLSRFGSDLSSVEISDLTVSGTFINIFWTIDSMAFPLTDQHCSQLNAGYHVLARQEDPG